MARLIAVSVRVTAACAETEMRSAGARSESQEETDSLHPLACQSYPPLGVEVDGVACAVLRAASKSV